MKINDKKQMRRPEVRLALASGWEYDGLTGGGHLRFRHPELGVLFMSQTPSDNRASRKIIAFIRRRIRAGPNHLH